MLFVRSAIPTLLRSCSVAFSTAALAIGAACVHADEALPPDLRARVDTVVRDALARTGVPSASIALVRNKGIVFANAYGWAELEPKRAAKPEMRYAIGSISKEFTATALLLLQEAHRVSIDDPAGKWVAGLGPASRVTIRSLLSHTSGIRDFWPQDYDPPEMLKPVTAQDIVRRWANQSLDFPTGTAIRYSNTGYTIAGMIAEKAAQQPLFQFLRERVFEPLRMPSAYDFDAAPLPQGDATGYTHYGLGPPRPAAKEGRGWLFAAGELAMNAADLARWDIAIIEHRLLSAASYRDLTTEILETSGVGTRYALGLDVVLESGRRLLRHSGEVGGFTASNSIYPDDGIALVVLTNEDATRASVSIADDLSKLLFENRSPADAAAQTLAQGMFSELQRGRVDAARLTSNAKTYFTDQALADFRSSLSPLGKPTGFALTSTDKRGGLTTRVYEISFAQKKLAIVTRVTPDGLFEQYTVSAE
jgi:D-alanyl-D-alanine carboxypeptidase